MKSSEKFELSEATQDAMLNALTLLRAEVSDMYARLDNYAPLPSEPSRHDVRKWLNALSDVDDAISGAEELEPNN